MPRYAEIDCDFACPHCGALIEGPIRFHWGRIPTQYKIGDRIKWRRTRSGDIVESFTIKFTYNVWNCGSPDIKDLHVFDNGLFGQDMRHTCLGCSGVVFGVVVEIRDGVIVDVAARTEEQVRDLLGDYVEAAEIVVIEEDGALTIRDDWFNPPIRIVD